MKYKVFNLNFSLDIQLSEFEKAGTDAFMATYPPDATNKQLFFTVVKITPDFLQQSGMPPEAVDMYVKGTFFGTAQPADKKLPLKITGQQIEYEIIKKEIPKPLILHLLKLVKDNTYYIGIEVENNELGEKIINQLQETLKYE